MRELRIASSQDAIVAKLNADLLMQRFLDVNLRENAETLGFQSLDRARDSFVEPGL
jgi:hypothetical protein